MNARLSCFNSGHRIEDHFVDITEMIGKGGQRPIKAKTPAKKKSE
jgi:hypothetical protein